MRIISAGRPECPCILKLHDWYDQNSSQVDSGAKIECDCGRVWTLKVNSDSSGVSWSSRIDRHRL